jgi:hypothetical protein
MDWLVYVTVVAASVMAIARIFGQRHVIQYTEVAKGVIAIAVFASTLCGLLLPQGPMQSVVVFASTMFGLLLANDYVAGLALQQRVYQDWRVRAGFYASAVGVCLLTSQAPFPLWTSPATPDSALATPSFLLSNLGLITVVLLMERVMLKALYSTVPEEADLLLGARVLGLRLTHSLCVAAYAMLLSSVIVVIAGVPMLRWPFTYAFAILAACTGFLSVFSLLPSRIARYILTPFTTYLLLKQRRYVDDLRQLDDSFSRTVALNTRLSYVEPRLQSIRWEIDIADARRLLWSHYDRALLLSVLQTASASNGADHTATRRRTMSGGTIQR